MMNLLKTLDRKAHTIVNEIDKGTTPLVLDAQSDDATKVVAAITDAAPAENVVTEEAAPQRATDVCCTAEATA